MRHIVRFSLVSLAVLFADVSVFGRDERERANSSGRLRLRELRKTRERSLDSQLQRESRRSGGDRNRCTAQQGSYFPKCLGTGTWPLGRCSSRLSFVRSRTSLGGRLGDDIFAEDDKVRVRRTSKTNLCPPTSMETRNS